MSPSDLVIATILSTVSGNPLSCRLYAFLPLPDLWMPYLVKIWWRPSIDWAPIHFPTLRSKPAPMKRSSQDPNCERLKTFPPSYFDLKCIQDSAMLVVTLSTNCSALVTSLLSTTWILWYTLGSTLVAVSPPCKTLNSSARSCCSFFPQMFQMINHVYNAIIMLWLMSAGCVCKGCIFFNVLANYVVKFLSSFFFVKISYKFIKLIK